MTSDDDAAQWGHSKSALVIGDSHSSFFSRNDRVLEAFNGELVRAGPFLIGHLGPALAASLVERQSANETREKALEALRLAKDEAVNVVILCFGEIDCRFHIRRRLEQSCTSVDAIELSTRVTVARYQAFICEVMLHGFTPIVYGPAATSHLVYEEPYPWPTLGTERERNRLTVEFTRQLKDGCESVGAKFITILPYLLDDKLNTRAEYLFDGVHVSQSAWPLWLAELNASQKARPRFNWIRGLWGARTEGK
jgi:lysophospholipase L1-like esterase